MYHLLISDESRLDILESFSWYERCRPGLGKEFEACLDAGFIKIQTTPLHFQKRYKQIRIHFIDRFPFGIHFLVDGDKVRVFGVFHTSRDPKNWTERLRSKSKKD
jgi:toxin ParE1/3/4